MTSFRLTPLIIFLILLAVLLFGYLMNHTWEYFTMQESFVTKSLDDYGEKLNAYSEKETKIVPIIKDSYYQIYFDPYAKTLVQLVHNERLQVVSRDSVETLHDYKSPPLETNIVKHENMRYKFSNGITGNTLTMTSNNTDEQLKELLKTQPADQRIMEVKTDCTTVQSIKTYTVPDVLFTEDFKNDKILESETNTHTYIRVSKMNSFIKEDASLEPTSTAKAFIYKAHLFPDGPDGPPQNRYAILHVPVSTTALNNELSTSNPTAMTFIHVMDLKNKKHVRTWFFNGNEIETYDSTNVMGDLDSSNDGDITFEDTGDISTEDGSFKVDVKSMKNRIYVGAIHGTSKFRVIMKLDGNDIIIKKIEVKANVAPGEESDDIEDLDDTSSTHEETDLEKTLKTIKSMKALFGSPDNDYFLKTEVVPPVCPQCPSCSNNGVCTNCGGNGGSGSSNSSGQSLARDFGSGVTNLIRDGADGATNLVRDGSDGVTNIARDAASGAYGVAKETAGGVTNTVGNATSGVGNFAKDAGGGVYGAASDAVGGAVGLGRDVVGGTYNAATGAVSGAVNLVTQRNSNYGSPGPSTAMGGHQNSYGGPYQQQQQQQMPAGQDPHQYFGAVPPRQGGYNYMPRTADFSSFGR